MKKSICIKEGRRIKKYRLGSVIMPLTIVRKHLYPTYENLFYNDRDSDESLIFTDLESSQIYSDGNLFLDPDDAIAILDTMNNSRDKIGFAGTMINNPMVFVYAGLGIVIVLTALGWI